MSFSKIAGILLTIPYQIPISFFIQMVMFQARKAPDHCWMVKCLQVSNWFINARVRLWKPMVEEMYKDELMREEAEECEREVRAETEREASSEPIGKLLDMNHDVQASIEAENSDHNISNDHSGQAGIGQVQRPDVQMGENELGLIHVHNDGESSSPHQPDIELEVFLEMPEEFAQVDNRLRPAMPLKICKIEPKDT
jgi:hypothetical protein